MDLLRTSNPYQSRHLTPISKTKNLSLTVTQCRAHPTLCSHRSQNFQPNVTNILETIF